jgi:hypothetical protein
MAPTKMKSLMKSLLRFLAEARVKPIDTKNDEDRYDDKFAHITLLN